MSFMKAWLVPGVIIYAMTSFCLKFAVGTYLVNKFTWLTDEHGLNLGNNRNYVSNAFDIGSLLGSIVLGLLSDKLFSKRSPVAFLACIIAAISTWGVCFGVN